MIMKYLYYFQIDKFLNFCGTKKKIELTNSSHQSKNQLSQHLHGWAMLLLRLKALADKNRLKILKMLISCDLCVGALAQHLHISKPAVSQHLQVLRKAGLIRGEKRGYWTHCMVNRQALVQVSEELKASSAKHKHNETICWRINEIPAETVQSKPANLCHNYYGQSGKVKSPHIVNRRKNDTSE